MSGFPIVLHIPVPPPANNLYVNGKRGRYISPRYKEWRVEANAWLMQQRRFWTPGWIDTQSLAGPLPLKVDIKVPKATRGDIDNRTKAALDLLVKAGVTNDDRHHHKVSIERDASVDCCVVTIEPWGEE